MYFRMTHFRGGDGRRYIMPEGTKVDRMYKDLRALGYDAGKAARIAQSKTGLSLKTGKPPKEDKK
jgi:hypothetical protein